MEHIKHRGTWAPIYQALGPGIRAILARHASMWSTRGNKSIRIVFHTDTSITATRLRCTQRLLYPLGDATNNANTQQNHQQYRSKTLPRNAPHLSIRRRPMKITHINTHNQQHPSSQRETSTTNSTSKPVDTRKKYPLFLLCTKANDQASTNILQSPRPLHNCLSKNDQQVNSHEWKRNEWRKSDQHKNNIQSSYKKRNQWIINHTVFWQLHIQHPEQDPIDPRGRSHEKEISKPWTPHWIHPNRKLIHGSHAP